MEAGIQTNINPDEIPLVRARGTQVRVVSAVTELGIVRGIAHHTSFAEIVREVEKAVGVLQEVAEWSKAEYRAPLYLADIGGPNLRSVLRGIYIWRWDTEQMERYPNLYHWKKPDHRFTVEKPTLLFIPIGWGGQ